MVEAQRCFEICAIYDDEVEEWSRAEGCELRAGRRFGMMTYLSEFFDGKQHVFFKNREGDRVLRSMRLIVADDMAVLDLPTGRRAIFKLESVFDDARDVDAEVVHGVVRVNHLQWRNSRTVRRLFREFRQTICVAAAVKVWKRELLFRRRTHWARFEALRALKLNGITEVALCARIVKFARLW